MGPGTNNPSPTLSCSGLRLFIFLEQGTDMPDPKSPPRDEEAAVVSHADSRAVRFVFEQRLTEWGAGIRRALAQVAATQFRDRLTSRARREAGSNDRIIWRSQRNRVSLAAQWILRPKQGRASLGSTTVDILYGEKRRSLMQTIAGMFPCQALFHCLRWGRSASPQCLLCEGRRKPKS